MSRSHTPHLFRRHCARFWTVALLLTGGSVGCDAPSTPHGEPDRLYYVDDRQTGRVGEALPHTLRVTVTDAEGREIPGVRIIWTALGGGSVDPVNARTDINGRSAAHRVLGPDAGEQTTTAAVSEMPEIPPVTFRHTAVAGD
jgi:hypothetical protein